MDRREFSKIALAGALALPSLPALAASGFSNASSRIPLGVCNHSLRGLKPNVSELIDYAIDNRLDSILLNNFAPLESREAAYLKKIKQKASDNDISIYVGAGSISENAVRFNDKWGSARELLKEGIRVASALGSPVVGCRIGTIDDRFTDYGIKRHIEDVIKVMQSLRQEALDAGVKFAFENHAGDLRSEELLALILETGDDICGALYDCGNAIWAMEDPMDALKTLGSHVICTSVRDGVVWGTDDGAMFQWTAAGKGQIDFPLLAQTLATVSPGVPLHVETVSNSPRPVPFFTPEFMKGFPDLSASDIVGFLKLLRQGRPLEFLEPPEGVSKKVFDIQHQKAELKASLDYLRKHCKAGRIA